jgi:hypothetical protein
VAFLAANPEVRHFLNHTSATAPQSFIDDNPELRIFLTHSDGNQTAGDEFFAANPEAGAMVRYAASQSQ